MRNARDGSKSLGLSRITVGAALALGLSALGAAPASSCGWPGGGGSGGGPFDPPIPYCGDGKMNDVFHGEQCDGNDFGGQTCASRSAGYVGTMKCTAYCQLDLSDCKVPTCGNGRIDPDEYCDGSNLNGEVCGEPPEGQVKTGEARCTPNCAMVDRSLCFARPGERCGNGIVETNERCDGPMSCAEYAEYTKRVFGTERPADYYADGTVQCSADCQSLDPSACKPRRCGNGVLDKNYPEQCDGADFGGVTCEDVCDIPLGGTLRCNRNCLFDMTLCHGCRTFRGTICL
jgi:hypothetical protein